ncbi:type II toxin-antitoxin system HigB family toxin [Cupriavidus lacunae]|uniref:Type II toxin-antitoxin system HigB family toxin n=1 Tax=Cupriavidus lacunae TaxID=2666307 RepID=A0A370NNX5_9BURK|nr:type II toxin-antitoxin system HigB family toxin [Cupriavidus lacunae]RDK07311.1 type II toxin-antitoxin system HigB family toxin [Cupriavidus lacunae]
MRIIAKRSLLEFSKFHPDSRQSLLTWHEEARCAAWIAPRGIKARYASTSFVGRNRVVFNIGGNKYRLIVAVAYRLGVVHVKFIGTHLDYDRIDAATVEME